MDSPRSRRTALWAAAAVIAAPAFLFPISNPDLFWHLSAGRWILENRALPRADFLSFSAPGAAWVDFEWLSELLFHSLHGLGGMAALWLLKLALLAASWLVVDRLLRLRGATPQTRAAALALWSAGMLPHSDIRPELFSVLFLSLLLAWLEDPRGPGRLRIFGLFLLWADLHAGFAAGLGVVGLYAAVAAARARRLEARAYALAAATAAAATLCNPYGPGPYRVLWRHWRESATLARTITEWKPMSCANPLDWPFWPMLLLLALLCAAAILRRRQASAAAPWAMAAAALGLAAASLAHGRNSIFFSATAVPAAFLLLGNMSWDSRRPIRKALLAAVLAYAAFALWLAPRITWAGAFNYRNVPRAAAEFMAREKPALQSLRLFNQWEWGGYLGWRLHPWYRVFCDGRYLFHEQLARTGLALASPERWQEFLAENRLSGGLMLNIERPFPSRKLYADGTTRPFQRPWYVFYMPKDRWALVYWDDQALLFVDRKAAPAAWLAAHEYRYARPKDEAARREALRLGEIPVAAAAAEDRRHGRELAEFGAR